MVSIVKEGWVASGVMSMLTLLKVRTITLENLCMCVCVI